jgi:hypothetical protein
MKGEWIGGPGIFGQRIIIQIKTARTGVDADILQNRPKAARGLIDFRLTLR